MNPAPADPISHPWLVPTVIVGVLGILLQGLKAAWDLVLSIKSQSNSARAVRLQELNALMSLIETLPLDPARKAARKTELLSHFQAGADSAGLYEVVLKVIAQCSGASEPASGSVRR